MAHCEETAQRGHKDAQSKATPINELKRLLYLGRKHVTISISMLYRVRASGAAATAVYVVIASCFCLALMLLLAPAVRVAGITPLPEPEPQPGSFGLEATKRQSPPSRGATITTPGSGARFTRSPITVNGLCPDGLLVQVYNNGVLVGATMCENGSFSIEVSLFAGTNDISVMVYDELGQAGPRSNVVTVEYTNAEFTAFGDLITLTSVYGRRSSKPGARLNWPLQLSGGVGPYAFSIDWGDGSAVELKSQQQAGQVDIAHSYKNAGIYLVNVKVADVNGASAFLQVVAVASGEVREASADKEVETKERKVILWVPAAATLGMLGPAFWLGRRSQTVSLRNRLLKEYKQLTGSE